VSDNALVWGGRPGHYEVYYLTFTDPVTGIGCWIRYTMLAPLDGPATAALWFLAMDPRPGAERPSWGIKETFGIDALQATGSPFQLTIGDAVLAEDRMTGAVEGASWDLRFAPSALGFAHVSPMLRRLGVAQTVLTLPQADLTIDGHIELAGERIALAGVHGGQAHLWGSKHARRWAWIHAGDLRDESGARVPETVLDGVSVFVHRLGRETGPNSPFVGRVDGEDFCSTSAVAVLANRSRFGLTGWRFDVRDGARRLIGEVDAPRDQLAGVTYHDPDGERAYCYNSETATLRLQLLHRARRVGGWEHRANLIAPGTAHFEYAQREPLPGLPLFTS
jgi:hypothetical protein